MNIDHVNYNQCIAPVSLDKQAARCMNLRASDKSRYCRFHLHSSHRTYIKYKRLTRLIERDLVKFYLNPNNDYAFKNMTPETARAYVLVYMRLIHRITECCTKRKIHIDKCVHPSCVDEQHMFQFTFLHKKYIHCLKILYRLYAIISKA